MRVLMSAKLSGLLLLSSVIWSSPVWSNQAPTLDLQAKYEVAAGQVFSLRVAPKDPDGGVPGVYVESGFAGSTFDDNGDGTRTFRAQVGDTQTGTHQLKFVAIDPQDSSLQTTQHVELLVVASGDAPTTPTAPTVPTTPTTPDIPATPDIPTAANGDCSIDVSDSINATVGHMISLLVKATCSDGQVPSLHYEPWTASVVFADNGNGTRNFRWTVEGERTFTIVATPATAGLQASSVQTRVIVDGDGGTETDQNQGDTGGETGGGNTGTDTDTDAGTGTVTAGGGDQVVPEFVDLGDVSHPYDDFRSFRVQATAANGVPWLNVEVPSGVTYDFYDNFDGTRSFSWLPHHPGSIAVTFVATDPVEHHLQTRKTVSLHAFEQETNQPPIFETSRRRFETRLGEELRIRFLVMDPDGPAPIVSYLGGQLQEDLQLTQISEQEFELLWSSIDSDALGVHLVHVRAQDAADRNFESNQITFEIVIESSCGDFVPPHSKWLSCLGADEYIDLAEELYTIKPGVRKLGDINGDGKSDLYFFGESFVETGSDSGNFKGLIIHGADSVDIASFFKNGYERGSGIPVFHGNVEFYGDQGLFGIGDVDNDGIDDLFHFDNETSRIIYGGDWTTLESINIRGIQDSKQTIVNLDTTDEFISDVFPVGDFNGDGIDDFAVRTFRRHSERDRYIRIVYGSESRQTMLDWASLTGNESLMVSESLEEDGLIIQSKRITTEFGDFDGDGFSDLALEDDRRFKIVYGNDEGNAEISISDLNGQNGFILTQGSDPRFGGLTGVVWGGDFNADGLADFYLVDRERNHWLIRGSIERPTAGIFSLTEGLALQISKLEPDTGDECYTDSYNLTDFSGDFNGDGYDDLLGHFDCSTRLRFGAHLASRNILYGNSIVQDQGLVFPAANALSSDLIVLGDQGLNKLVNDFNGDGYDDLLVRLKLSDDRSSNITGTVLRLIWGRP